MYVHLWCLMPSGDASLMHACMYVRLWCLVPNGTDGLHWIVITLRMYVHLWCLVPSGDASLMHACTYACGAWCPVGRRVCTAM
jgi:hypothetical protein